MFVILVVFRNCNLGPLEVKPQSKLTMPLPRGRPYSVNKQPASASMTALREAIRGPGEYSVSLTFNSILFSFREGPKGKHEKETQRALIRCYVLSQISVFLFFLQSKSL